MLVPDVNSPGLPVAPECLCDKNRETGAVAERRRIAARIPAGKGQPVEQITGGGRCFGRVLAEDRLLIERTEDYLEPCPAGCLVHRVIDRAAEVDCLVQVLLAQV